MSPPRFEPGTYRPWIGGSTNWPLGQLIIKTYHWKLIIRQNGVFIRLFRARQFDARQFDSQAIWSQAIWLPGNMEPGNLTPGNKEPGNLTPRQYGARQYDARQFDAHPRSWAYCIPEKSFFGKIKFFSKRPLFRKTTFKFDSGKNRFQENDNCFWNAALQDKKSA